MIIKILKHKFFKGQNIVLLFYIRIHYHINFMWISSQFFYASGKLVIMIINWHWWIPYWILQNSCHLDNNIFVSHALQSRSFFNEKKKMKIYYNIYRVKMRSEYLSCLLFSPCIIIKLDALLTFLLSLLPCSFELKYRTMDST